MPGMRKRGKAEPRPGSERPGREEDVGFLMIDGMDDPRQGNTSRDDPYSAPHQDRAEPGRLLEDEYPIVFLLYDSRGVPILEHLSPSNNGISPSDLRLPFSSNV